MYRIGKMMLVPRNLQQPFQVEVFLMKASKWVMMVIYLPPLMMLVMLGGLASRYSHPLDPTRALLYLRCSCVVTVSYIHLMLPTTAHVGDHRAHDHRDE